MASYIAVREDGRECVASAEMHRENVNGSGIWNIKDLYTDDITVLRKGTIKKILGVSMTWDDEPFKVDMTFNQVMDILNKIETKDSHE